MSRLDGINQLRALSVLLVFLFHADFVYAGFIGVDIFFVISGFLIGSSILKLDNNSATSLKKFYGRRVLRIFPALAAVILVTMVINLILINDESRIYVNRSGISALLFSSNIYDSLFSDYFATSASYNPYSHLWSLGIEEQFYLIIAPIIIFIKRYLQLIIVMMISSFCFFIFPINDTSLIYFFPIFRIWELFSGVILAVYFIRTKSEYKIIKKNYGNIIIILFFIISIFGFQPETMILWKLQTIIVVILTIYFILNCPFQISNPLLNRVSNFIGELSFGIYLVHLPILVYFRWTIGYIDFNLLIIAFIISIIFSYLMHKYWESIFWKSSLNK